MFSEDHNQPPQLDESTTQAALNEECLSVSEGMFRAVFGLSPDPVTLSDLNSGRIVEANQAWCALAGLPREEVLGRNPRSLGFWTNPAGRDAIFRELLEKGFTADREYEFKAHDGTVRNLLVAARLVAVQGEQRVLVAGKDVTDRHRAGLALLASEERFRTMAEECPVALFIYRDGRFVYVNPAAVALFRAQDPEELLGNEVLDRVHPDQRAVAWENILKAMTSGEDLHSADRIYVRMDGSLVDVAITCRPVDYDGQPAMLAFAQDISQARKAHEEELRARKAESLVLMAGSIAHDFNNLFQALTMNLELAVMGCQDRPQVLQSLAGARSALAQATALSWKMLDFSGCGHTKLQTVQLGEWLETWAAARAALPPNRSLEMDLDSVPDVAVDPVKLVKVLGILLENALEAMDEAGMEKGQVRVKLSVASIDSQDQPGLWAAAPATGKKTVCLEFANDGPTPDEAVLGRMFDPFFTTKALGRGLGLPSALGLLQAHGAGIQVLPGNDSGLAFRIHFPSAQ